MLLYITDKEMQKLAKESSYKLLEDVFLDYNNMLKDYTVVEQEILNTEFGKVFFTVFRSKELDGKIVFKKHDFKTHKVAGALRVTTYKAESRMKRAKNLILSKYFLI